jgi:hypothetical protein
MVKSKVKHADKILEVALPPEIAEMASPIK